eukprot:7133157-Pyramimonas_sp.AAC.1
MEGKRSIGDTLNNIWVIIPAKSPSICSLSIAVVGIGFGGFPYGATKRAKRVPRWGGPCARCYWGLGSWVCSPLFYGATKRVWGGCADMELGRHPSVATRAF